MGRLIDTDEVKKKFPIMENDFGMVINERLHKELDKIPAVEAIPKAKYENRLKADLKAMLTELQLEIEEKFNDRPFSYNHHQRTEFYRDIDEIIQQKINKIKEKSNEV